MNILRLIIFVVLVACVSCAEAPRGDEPVVLDEASLQLKSDVEQALEENSATHLLGKHNVPFLQNSLASLASKGFAPLVGRLFTMLHRLQVRNNISFRCVVLSKASIQATAKLLQLDCVRHSISSYEVIRREDAGELMAYLRVHTDILDGDRLKVWLKRVALLCPSRDDNYAPHLIPHASYEALKAAYDELLPSEEYKNMSLEQQRRISNIFLSAMTRVNKRRQALLEIFAGEDYILPNVIVEIVNQYITADA